MKPTLANLSRRLEALENAPQVAAAEPIILRITYVQTRPDGQQVPPTRYRQQQTGAAKDGRAIIIEHPVFVDENGNESSYPPSWVPPAQDVAEVTEWNGQEVKRLQGVSMSDL